ncbi:Monoacylglycerol lipase ABHD6, partial [Ophiophagus hannah]
MSTVTKTKRLKMGVKVKYLNNEGYQFSYFTRGEPGSQPSVLMLHGFSLNKDMWLNTIEFWKEGIRMGEHLTKEQPQSLCSKCLFQFVQCAGLNHKPFHLVGMSMGGMVAGVYAALYPAHISSLALFCPAGVRYLTDSEFFAQLRELIFSKGSVENTVIPVTEEQLENFVKLCLYHPIFLKIQVKTKRLSLGVKVKYLNSEDYRFRYFTRGKPGSQPSVLMLHGFSLNKDMWLNTIEVGLPFILGWVMLAWPWVFPKDLHLVCLDLPGHGGTTRLLGESHTALAQAKRIHQFQKEGIRVGEYLMKEQPQSLCSQCLFQFVQCAGLNHNPFHLVGISMGGMVAGIYATLYPAHVFSLALLCPAGFLDLTSSESRYSLHDNMRKIKAPTQIIWGKDDKVFDSSGAGILAAAIPNSQVHLLEKCGHFITLERPRTSARLLLEFYKSVCDSAKQKKVA